MPAHEEFHITKPPASETSLQNLRKNIKLPTTYWEFLQHSDGAEQAPTEQIENEYILKLFGCDNMMNFCYSKDIWKKYPNLQCFAISGPDCAFAFDASSHPPERWPIIAVPLDSSAPPYQVAESFVDWEDLSYYYDTP